MVFTPYNATLADGTAEMLGVMMGMSNLFFLVLSMVNATQYLSTEPETKAWFAAGFQRMCTPMSHHAPIAQSEADAGAQASPSVPYRIERLNRAFETFSMCKLWLATNLVFAWTWFAFLFMVLIPIAWMFDTFYYPASANGQPDVPTAWITVLLMDIVGLIILWPLTMVIITAGARTSFRVTNKHRGSSMSSVSLASSTGTSSSRKNPFGPFDSR